MSGQIERIFRCAVVYLAIDAAVPGHSGLERGIVGGIQPGDAAAPAETRDRQTTSHRRHFCGPDHAGVEIGHDSGIGRLGDDSGEDVLDVGHLARVAVTGEEFGRDGKVTFLRQPAADIGDVLMHAEDLGDHQHHRQGRLPGRHGTVGEPSRRRRPAP